MSRGALMRLLTAAQHHEILTAFPENAAAAEEYAKRIHKPVTPQNVAYWRNVHITNKGKQAATDRIYHEERRLRKPSPSDDIGVLPDFKKIYKSILVIPDQHTPYHHKDMCKFLAVVATQFKPDLVVNLGDETDFHALSFHDSDPNLDSAGTELEKAKVALEELYQLFPNMLICDSNHGSMVYRKAKHCGIPVQAIKSYRDILFPSHSAKGWSWADHWLIQTPTGLVKFQHEAKGGALAQAAHERCNLVAGHNHGLFLIEYSASSECLYWGATCGCLIDNSAMAFSYGKLFPRKPIVGCMVIFMGIPMLIPMQLDREGNWTGVI